jgi:hypothetical protein
MREHGRGTYRRQTTVEVTGLTILPDNLSGLVVGFWPNAHDRLKAGLIPIRSCSPIASNDIAAAGWSHRGPVGLREVHSKCLAMKPQPLSTSIRRISYNLLFEAKDGTAALLCAAIRTLIL